LFTAKIQESYKGFFLVREKEVVMFYLVAKNALKALSGLRKRHARWRSALAYEGQKQSSMTDDDVIGFTPTQNCGFNRQQEEYKES
jgi:hypothetical protein